MWNTERRGVDMYGRAMIEEVSAAEETLTVADTSASRQASKETSSSWSDIR